MSNRNISTRSCTLNRRPVEHSEVYHVIIFPCDNSFSVVKSKQCSPAEQDGFVFVQSGQKKYMGFIFATGKMDVDHQTMAKLFFDLGNFEMSSKVADRLCQKRHEEIESDYERQNENTRPKEATSNTPEKTYTTLKDVPLSIDIPVAVVHQASSRQIVSNFTTTTNSATYIISNNLLLSSPVRETSLPTTKISSTTASSSNLNGRNRSTVDWSPSPSHNKKKKRSVKNQKDNVSSSDIESDDEDLIRTNEIIKTPTFTGRRITNSITTDCVTKVPIDAESYFRQMEKKYFSPLLIALERIEKMIQTLYKNQLKIQKTLNKKQVSIALDEPGADDNDDMNFPSSLIFNSADGMSSVDLLKIPATRDKANLYVTNLVEKMFSIDELVELKPDQTHEDSRYQMIRG
ncbi:unnamed protein product [Rotaria magnacalcarata]|uniref:Uncharacterized protein n=1 Tax=Rotaria magnacalcarata TaxID=392030 RepID=A0A816BPL1_9BILA|nr:unnamed protein product [Rotaria magnacalcarata]